MIDDGDFVPAFRVAVRALGARGVDNPPMDLADEYRALVDLPPGERSKRLPMLVARLLERDGYHALMAASAATPRDADLVASSIDEDYLLEIKSGGKPAGVDAIDSIFVRLERMPSHVVGLVISRSGFTRGAVALVTARRTRLILLFDGDELSELFEGGLTVRVLARAKRLALVRDAEMRFFGGRSVLELPRAAEWGTLPRANVAFPDSSIGGGTRAIVSAGSSHDIVFAASIPDVDWTIAMGNGAGLDVDVPIRFLDDLGGLFETLRRSSWLTPAGRFAIHQTHVSWHGAGASDFLEALRRQSERYSTVSDVPLHNEEHAVYFDEYSAGLYTVALRVVADAVPWILDAQLSLQLPGVPLDPSGLRLTMRSLGLEERAVFRSLNAAQRVSATRFKASDVPLQVQRELIAIDPLMSAEETWVSGVVASNPLQGARASELPEDLQATFASIDTIVCSLGSWYTTDSRPSSFYLKHLDAVRTASAVVVAAAAEWQS